MFIGPTERTAVEDNQAAKEKNGQTMWTKKGFWNVQKCPSKEGLLQRKTWLLKTCCEAKHVRILWVFQLLPTNRYPQQRETFSLPEKMARTILPKQAFRNDADFCFQNALLQRKKWRFETCSGGYHTQEEKNADFVNLFHKHSLQHNPGNSNLMRYIFRFISHERNEGKHPRQGETFRIPQWGLQPSSATSFISRHSLRKAIPTFKLISPSQERNLMMTGKTCPKHGHRATRASSCGA